MSWKKTRWPTVLFGFRWRPGPPSPARFEGA
jgi:hypothetical protein